MKIDTSTLRLFKAFPITTKKKKINKQLLKITIPRGYIFSPEVVANYADYNGLMDLVEEIYGITAERLNSSFHKSWAKIKNTPQEELMVEQLAHYLTTYGKEAPAEYLIEKEEQFGVPHLAEKIIELPDFESEKIREENYVYIPKEALHIPHWDKEDVRLVVIKGLTKKELKTKLMDLLGSEIALGEDTIKDAVEIAKFVELDDVDIEDVKNKEVKSALYDHLGLVPENPVEFLRFVVFKSTGQTLLIKNKALIEKIKEGETVNKFFAMYIMKNGMERLAEIFLRFKPIFLAFKVSENMKPVINKIRKLAVRYHRPMSEDFLNTVTARLKKSEEPIGYLKLRAALQGANVFRKIRLAYALKYRTKDVDSIIYKIRNGKGWATSFSFKRNGSKTSVKRTFDIVLDSIVEDVGKNVKGKRIYIPEHIHYALPATEKQFTGNFPSGTYVSVPKDIIFGINWENVDGHRIDLDLSLISPSGGKIGWDASYSTEDILWSGDITDACGPNGATELFYVKRQKKEAQILFVNYYNFEEGVDVPFKIIVAQERVSNWGKNYMVDPNNLVAVSNSKINKKEMILGLLVTTFDECRFYFTETSTGTSITSSESEVAEHSRRYLFGFYENTIGLNDILTKAGAKIISSESEYPVSKGETFDIDLSPEALEKDSILNLLKK